VGPALVTPCCRASADSYFLQKQASAGRDWNQMFQGTENNAHKLAMESIRKEERTRWNHDARTTGSMTLRDAGGVLVTPRLNSATPRVSAAVRFLEEKTGLADPAADRPLTRELLYRGVSHDGNGRAEYLKERKKYNVLDRYGIPCTVSHQYGLGDDGKETTNFAASPNCKKPIVQRSFFRAMGVATYKDPPVT